MSAYVGSPKNLKDLRARTGSVDLPKPRFPLPRTYPQKIHAAFRITSGPPVHRIAADSSLNHFTQRGVGTFRTLRLAPIPQFRGTTNPRRWLTFLRSLRIFGLKLKSQKLSEYLGQHSTSYSRCWQGKSKKIQTNLRKAIRGGIQESILTGFSGYVGDSRQKLTKAHQWLQECT